MVMNISFICIITFTANSVIVFIITIAIINTTSLSCSPLLNAVPLHVGEAGVHGDESVGERDDQGDDLLDLLDVQPQLVHLVGPRQNPHLVLQPLEDPERLLDLRLQPRFLCPHQIQLMSDLRPISHTIVKLMIVFTCRFVQIMID